MGNNIIIFTLDGCEYCDNLKNKLNNLNIPFQEFEITRNRTIWNQVIEQTPYNPYPNRLNDAQRDFVNFMLNYLADEE